MGRSLLFAANWKMHHGPAEARQFASQFMARNSADPARHLWFFPPAVSLAATAAAFAERADIRVGAQNVHWEEKGAFTGETSVPLARAAGAAGALVGHSERRHLFGETDEETRRKVMALLAADLTPFLCVGETLEQREQGATEAIVLRQVRAALEGLTAAQLGGVVIAYEPVWAIGTGRNATPEDASAVHAVIRAELAALGAVGHQPILYGGSVNAGNAAALLGRREVDGVLVGGASLDAAGWAGIVQTDVPG
ncbi:MAG TPA: triose-phosphate isomerase [Gemmatimonadales bacterium]|nr:triose-phosphate isomerase [Gemmatimonadales bacterium]